MIKKMICYSDVDGTIYGRDFTVSEELKKDILNFQKNNGEFVISTGNPAFARHRKLAADLNVRYLITSNGSAILDTKEDKFIYINRFPIDIQNKIILAAQKYKSHINYWTDYRFFTANVKKEFDYCYDYSLFTRDMVELNDKPHPNVVKMEVFDTEENIKNIYLEIKDLDINIVYMRKQHIEITMKKSSKGQAARWLSENVFNEKIENAMTIGDSPNDWTMLEISDFSYAMENSGDDTKKIAKFHTSTYNQNGVGLALRDYMDRVKSKNNSNK
ncbi:HAD-IIB family hydrolase [Mesomycoplasma lagogenitalium]|uniref:HAD-IIB family hydrolase n=1 Tax=Mesomycoplasma lagogenitalium TaxID=171286 RepID=A0ABY8LVK9_9BACT|nr:HAD-IIB family hydrolase [Mesomycoplasma lagogenitalium]WGI36296.1 HAD-IIB family hydrolase [Mesomycoplasma lagogenitalium]